VQTSLKHGYAFPINASRLKQVASGIQLPSVLAQYIEAIGSFQLSSTATVVPLSKDYAEMFPPGSILMVDPAELLLEANRDVPHGDWALDVEWIVAYNEATTRASRTGMRFRNVDQNDLVGRSEMVVSYYETPDDMLQPVAPQVMSEAEAQLGAAYMFRDYNQLGMWPGDNAELLFDAFTAIPFDPRVVVSDICVASFKGLQITMD